MRAVDIMTDEDVCYAVSARRHLHQYPEIGMELDNTAAFVKSRLEESGIPWSDRYGKNSVAAYVGPANAQRTIAFRADMDALPVEEKTGLSFASLIPDRMHACGHDAHTGILLSVARILKRQEQTLPCRIKFLFQPNEEGETSGARMMMENGAMDDADMVFATHCDNTVDCGLIGIRAGDYMSACTPITITFHGKTAHATLAEQGVDALAMATDAYRTLKALVRDMAEGKTPYIFSVGVVQGGTAHNVIADTCVMKISFRYRDMAFASRVRAEALAECERIATSYGGSFECSWEMSAPPLHNDEHLTQRFSEIIREYAALPIQELPQRMSTEDFSWFLMKKPGMVFRFGTRNEQKGCVTLAHCNDFCLDEDGMRLAILAFVQIALCADTF